MTGIQRVLNQLSSSRFPLQTALQVVNPLHFVSQFGVLVEILFRQLITAIVAVLIMAALMN